MWTTDLEPYIKQLDIEHNLADPARFHLAEIERTRLTLRKQRMGLMLRTCITPLKSFVNAADDACLRIVKNNAI